MSDNTIKASSIKRNDTWLKVVIYIVSIFFSIMKLFPFIMMFANSFKSTFEIQQSTLTLWSAHPFQNFARNWYIINSKDFHPMTGFLNSLIVATFSTILNVYFSSLTAYAITAYEW